MLSKECLERSVRGATASVQWIALPYAAGSLRSYYPLTKVTGIELVKYELPGRGFRQFESLPSMSTVIEEVIDKIDFSRPYVLFGHSMGAYISYEVCSLIETKHLPPPKKVILSGQVPPNINRVTNFSREFSTQEAIAYFRGTGGTPDEVLENEELMELFSEMLNQDFRFLHEYLRGGWTEKVVSNLEIWFGDRDLLISDEHIYLWKKHTTGNCEFICFEGNHFFINDIISNPEKINKFIT
ncbi:thioesterase II family protein [Paenibacillus sp. SN-8-1]|uniref:thioesterase II family protein n=1 Tax=Paenibacillus sp. SN-8-1 TaxID=3435409 RepID=UPI003D9A9CE7